MNPKSFALLVPPAVGLVLALFDGHRHLAQVQDGHAARVARPGSSIPPTDSAALGALSLPERVSTAAVEHGESPRDRTAAHGTAAAPPLAAIPTTTDEVASSVAPRVLERFALYREPTEGMYAAWYRGTNLEELAGLRHDGVLVLRALSGEARGTNTQLQRLGQQKESLTSEVEWLGGELARRIELPSGPVPILFAERDASDLARTFPSDRERFALRSLMLRELHALTREAAWGQGATRLNDEASLFL